MWQQYSQKIQQRTLGALDHQLKVKSAKELRMQIFRSLNQAHDAGLLTTTLAEIHKLLRISENNQKVEIVGGLEKAGPKNFNQSKDIPHFLRCDGCWFDFAITVDEKLKPAEIIGFDFEIRFPGFPDSIPLKFVRFDLNLPDHANQSDGLRFHLHPGCNDFMVHSPPMSPVEILHLFIYGFEIPDKMRQ